LEVELDRHLISQPPPHTHSTYATHQPYPRLTPQPPPGTASPSRSTDRTPASASTSAPAQTTSPLDAGAPGTAQAPHEPSHAPAHGAPPPIRAITAKRTGRSRPETARPFASPRRSRPTSPPPAPPATARLNGSPRQAPAISARPSHSPECLTSASGTVPASGCDGHCSATRPATPDPRARHAPTDAPGQAATATPEKTRGKPPASTGPAAPGAPPHPSRTEEPFPNTSRVDLVGIPGDAPQPKKLSPVSVTSTAEAGIDATGGVR